MPKNSIADLEQAIAKRKAEIRKACKKARRSVTSTEALITSDPEIRDYEYRIQKIREALSQPKFNPKDRKQQSHTGNYISDYLNKTNPNQNLATTDSGAIWKARPQDQPYEHTPGNFTPQGYEGTTLYIPGTGVVGREQFMENNWVWKQVLGLKEDMERMLEEEQERQREAQRQQLQAWQLYSQQLQLQQANQAQQQQQAQNASGAGGGAVFNPFGVNQAMLNKKDGSKSGQAKDKSTSKGNPIGKNLLGSKGGVSGGNNAGKSPTGPQTAGKLLQNLQKLKLPPGGKKT